MPSDLSGIYEAVLPVSTKDRLVPAGGEVKLSHEDAEIFLARGLVRESESGSAQQRDDSGGNLGDGADELSVTPDAGREALLEAGYTADEEVRAASDDDLLALDGIGQGRLAKIREILPHLPNESD